MGWRPPMGRAMGARSQPAAPYLNELLLVSCFFRTAGRGTPPPIELGQRDLTPLPRTGGH